MYAVLRTNQDLYFSKAENHQLKCLCAMSLALPILVFCFFIFLCIS